MVLSGFDLLYKISLQKKVKKKSHPAPSPLYDAEQVPQPANSCFAPGWLWKFLLVTDQRYMCALAVPRWTFRTFGYVSLFLELVQIRGHNFRAAFNFKPLGLHPPIWISFTGMGNGGANSILYNHRLIGEHGEYSHQSKSVLILLTSPFVFF